MENGRLNFYKFVDSLINYRSLKINAYKYSYIIVKPNGARHFKTYVNELEKNGFDVIEYYAIVDYETINMKLHTDPAVQKYIIPVNKMFKDCFGNYAVLVLIAKRNVSYFEFVKQVDDFKIFVRTLFKLDYISNVFDISKLFGDNQEQRLVIMDKLDNEISKHEMNERGTFYIFSVNSIHAPDPEVSTTISELMILIQSNIISENNIIPNNVVECIGKYKSFEFLQDM